MYVPIHEIKAHLWDTESDKLSLDWDRLIVIILLICHTYVIFLICHIVGMIILMTRLNFCFKQLYIWTFPDQSTVKHNPDQGQDIWNMQNNSEKCDRSWRQGRHSSQNNLGGLSLSLSFLTTDHLACAGHYWWCLPAWSFISMMSNISCPANCNYVWNFLQCFLQEKNVLWIVVNVFELSFCNKLNGSNVKMWYAAQCLRFWLEVVAKVVTKGKQNSFWSSEVQ